MKSPAKSPVAGHRGRPFDRHSGTGTRGLPKKKGAGGKGVWGSAMDQEGVACLDNKDPNYDSDKDNQLPPQLDLNNSAQAEQQDEQDAEHQPEQHPVASDNQSN